MAKRIIFIATQLFAVFLIIFSLYELYQLGSTMLIGSRHSSSSIQPTEGGSWETLRDVNPDIIGWLTIEGTGVDFPILQDRELHRVFKETGGLPASYLSSHAEKTREEIVFKYLFYDFKGEPSETGSITIDFRNSLEDPYIIIYGHNVGLPGVMFSDLKQFEKAGYFNDHRSASIKSEAGAPAPDVRAGERLFRRGLRPLCRGPLRNRHTRRRGAYIEKQAPGRAGGI